MREGVNDCDVTVKSLTLIQPHLDPLHTPIASDVRPKSSLLFYTEITVLLLPHNFLKPLLNYGV